MDITKKKKKEAAVNYDVEVTHAHEFKSGDISFDIIVNGVNLYGLTYMNEDAKRNIKKSFISFPARKGNDGNYYNHAWFKIDDKLQGEIEEQIEAMI